LRETHNLFTKKEKKGGVTEATRKVKENRFRGSWVKGVTTRGITGANAQFFGVIPTTTDCKKTVFFRNPIRED